MKKRSPAPEKHSRRDFNKLLAAGLVSSPLASPLMNTQNRKQKGTLKAPRFEEVKPESGCRPHTAPGPFSFRF